MALSIEYWVNYTEGNVKMRRKSEAAVTAGRVLSFVYDDTCMAISSHVQASMKDKSYKILVYLTATYGVSQSTCECPLKMSKCHHVAATLLYGYRHVAKTDVKCSWIKHPKSAPPKETQTIEELFPTNKPDYRALDRPVNQADRDFLFKELSLLGRYTAMHWVLAPEPEKPKDHILSVGELMTSQGYLEAASPKDWLKEKLAVSQDSISRIAQMTIGQRLNPLWGAVRKLRLTASNFSFVLDAFNKRRVTKSCKKRLLSSYNLEKVAPIVWGITHEKEGIAAYKALGGDVQETGIWLHSSGILGASPDGLVTKQPQTVPHLQTPEASLLSPDVLEIKCPYSARNGTVREAVKSAKDFFLEEKSDGLALRTTHAYYHQVQGQLYLTQKYCADFLVWTPTDVEIIRIAKDPTWETNIEKLQQFYFEFFLDLIDED